MNSAVLFKDNDNDGVNNITINNDSFKESEANEFSTGSSVTIAENINTNGYLSI